MGPKFKISTPILKKLASLTIHSKINFVRRQIKGPICKFFENRIFSENSSKGLNAHMASEIGIKLAVFKRKNVNRAFHILHDIIAIAFQFYS